MSGDTSVKGKNMNRLGMWVRGIVHRVAHFFLTAGFWLGVELNHFEEHPNHCEEHALENDGWYYCKFMYQP